MFVGEKVIVGVSVKVQVPVAFEQAVKVKVGVGLEIGLTGLLLAGQPNKNNIETKTLI